MKKMIAVLMIAIMGMIMGCTAMNTGGMKDNRQMEQNSDRDEGGGEGGGCGC